MAASGRKGPVSTPFDERLLWVHQGGDNVLETEIAALAERIRSATPNVSGLLLKTSHGADWQGARESRQAMAITGPAALQRWARTLGRAGLETHLWCVLRGVDLDAEVRLVTQACRVPGARSMLLAFEAEPGGSYFSAGDAARARELIARIRAGIAPDFHLGLNLDARGRHPANIHLREWAPWVQSLHPMIFHYEFGGGRSNADAWLDQAFGTLERHGLPLVPMLQTYPRPGPVPAEHIARAAASAWSKGASGLSLFRYGGDCSSEPILQAVRGINPQGAQLQPDVAGAGPRWRRFRVSAATLRARRLPRRSSTVLARLPWGSMVDVSGDSRTETDGYVWWRGPQGWLPQGRSDRRHTLMVEVTPATPPQGQALLASRLRPPQGVDGPETLLKGFRVLADGLSVRSQAASGSDYLRAARLQRDDELWVEADAWVEQDGFRWWFHGTGWSAELAAGSGLRFLEDLTPEVQRMRNSRPPLAQFSARAVGLRAWSDDAPQTEVGEEGEELTQEGELGEVTDVVDEVDVEEEAPVKRFRVQVPRLAIRSHPSLAGTKSETRLLQDESIEVRADAWVEQDDYLWWLHETGWSVERSLDGDEGFMEDLTPDVERSVEGARGRPEDFPGAPPPRDERPRWQVLALTLPVHDAPGARSVRSGRLEQGDILRVPEDPARLVEADDYLWLRHGEGWSAVRRLDGRAEFLLNLDSLPLLGTLLRRHPVDLEEVNWAQYFGNTSFAWRRGREYSYHRYAQGLHSGLDYGCYKDVRPGPRVFAGLEGVSAGRGNKYGPNRLDVRVGPYRIIYGHLGAPANLPREAPVSPQTQMGRIEHTLYHIHLEVRYKDSYILNPLLFMSSRMVNQFLERFPLRVGRADDTHVMRFMQTETWDRWQTPLDQPVIRLGGELIGPTAG